MHGCLMKIPFQLHWKKPSADERGGIEQSLWEGPSFPMSK